MSKRRRDGEDGGSRPTSPVAVKDKKCINTTMGSSSRSTIRSEAMKLQLLRRQIVAQQLLKAKKVEDERLESRKRVERKLLEQQWHEAQTMDVRDGESPPRLIWTVAAPPGKLRIVLGNLKNHRGTLVKQIKRDSVLEGKLHVGDRIIGVDALDVSDFSVDDLTTAMSSRHNSFRMLTIRRGVKTQPVVNHSTPIVSQSYGVASAVPPSSQHLNGYPMYPASYSSYAPPQPAAPPPPPPPRPCPQQYTTMQGHSVPYITMPSTPQSTLFCFQINNDSLAIARHRQLEQHRCLEERAPRELQQAFLQNPRSSTQQQQVAVSVTVTPKPTSCSREVRKRACDVLDVWSGVRPAKTEKSLQKLAEIVCSRPPLMTPMTDSSSSSSEEKDDSNSSSDKDSLEADTSEVSLEVASSSASKPAKKRFVSPTEFPIHHLATVPPTPPKRHIAVNKSWSTV